MNERPPIEEYLRDLDLKDAKIITLCLYTLTLEAALFELGRQVGKNAEQLAQEYLEQKDIIN